MRRQWLIPAGMAVICALLYTGIVKAPFILDDNSFIVNAPQVHMTQFSFSAVKSAAFEGMPGNRPLSKISFALNFFFGKYDPTGYHLVNIAIHVFVSFFVYLLFAQVLFIASGGKPEDKKKSRMIALAAALVWMVHPLHVESVTYVCQRMTSLSALFFVGSLWCYGEARLRQQGNGGTKAIPVFFAAAFFSGVLALLSKENAATLPIFILLYERLFFTKPENRGVFRIAVLVSLVVFGAIAVFYLGPHPMDRITRSYANRTFNLGQRLFTESRIVVYYIGLILLPYPSRLNLDYAYPVSTSPLHPPTTLLSILCLSALVVLGGYAARKDKVLCFAIFWFLGNLAIESSFVGLELIFEHRTYLPSMLLFLWLIKALADKIRSQRVRISAFCVVFLLFSGFTYQRNKVWADPISLWSDCVKKSPAKVRPNFNLGCFLEKNEKYDAAIRFFTVAEKITPNFDQTHYHLGSCLGRLGKYAGAEKAFKRALALNPDNAAARNNLANVFVETGRLVSAATEYKKALALTPKDASIRINLAGVLAGMEKTDEAILQYQKALSYAPANVGALNDMGYLLLQQGRTGDARQALEKAISIDPHNAGAMARLGDLFTEKGDFRSAVNQYTRALSIDPDDAETRYNFGIALYRMGKTEDACLAFDAAQRLDSGLTVPSGIRAQCGK